MAGALDDDQVLAPRHALVGGGHLRAKVVADAPIDVVGREVARQGDRAHVVERVGEVEDLLHQDRVLVGTDPLHEQRPLADGLHEAQRVTRVAERGDQPKARGRLAAVLARGGQEDAARHPRAAVLRRPTSSTASRSRVTRSRVQHVRREVLPSRSIMSAAMASSTSASAMKNCGSLL